MRCGSRNPNERLVWSEPFNWPAGGGGGDSFKMDFLAKAGRMTRPMVTSLKFRLQQVLTTTSGNSLRGQQTAQILDRLFIADRDGERVELSGQCIVHVMRTERRNPFIARDLAVATATQARTIWLEIPIEPWGWVEEPTEWRWDARSLMRGEMTFNWLAGTALGTGATTNLATIVSSDIRCFATVIDEGDGRESHKFRSRYKSFLINSSETTYPVVGAVAWAKNYIGDVADAKVTPDVWATQQLTSVSLDVQNADDNYLNDLDLERRMPRRTAPNLTADEDDGTVLGTLQNIHQRMPSESVTEYPLVSELDMKTTLAVGSGTFVTTSKPKLMVHWVEERKNQCGKVPPPGVVKTKDGPRAISRIPDSYQKILPIHTPPGALDKIG